MKKLIAALSLAAAFAAGSLVTAQMRDWHDLDAVHKHVQEAIHELERARAANHYDMAGHGVKAEEFLRQAERELDMAVKSAQGQ
jgi:hypothetical protein